jgi:tetratricopeptide (TPR) repeat protein
LRTAVKCTECAFENPRGWVTCARCGALLGPRLRRLGESGTYGGPITTTTQHRVPDEPEPDAEPEERTRVYAGAPTPQPSQPTVAAQTAGEAAAPSEAKLPPHRDARPLLGQDECLGRIKQVLETAFARGEPRVIVLQGAPGSGKTLMLQRASELAAALRPEVAVHYASLRSRDDGPYAPVSRLLLDRFGVTPASSPASVRAEMEQNVAAALGAADRASETAPLLGHVAGVPFPDSLLLRELQRDPEALRGQAVAGVARFVAGEAQRGPLLWLLDEMTDAEPGAWELVGALLEQQGPLVVVLSGRPPLLERAAALRLADRVERVELKPLALTDCTQLVHLLVPDLLLLEDELAAALMHRSGGNPRQLIELVRALQDGGLFRREEQGVVVDMPRLERGGLPLTMADSIRARLVTLGQPELQVMRDAAVVGEHFWDGALLALRRAREPLPERTLSVLELWMPSDDELALQHALDALEAKGFIVRIADAFSPGLGEYTFPYAGTRSLVYADLPEAERAASHAVIARWLAATTGLAVENATALLAPQLERAGDRAQAARAYLAAATDERARMRTTMALHYVDKALPLIAQSDAPLRIEALHERGSLLSTLGRYGEALASFEEIARLAWLLGARGRGGAALNRIARIHRERGEHEDALEHLRAALALFGSLGDQRGLASSYDDMAQIHRMRGELDPALSAAKEALAIRVETQDRRGQALSLNTIGRIELDLGQHDAAEARFRTALEIREALADHEGAVQTRLALGQLAFRRGRVDEAIRIYQGALDAARELSHQRFEGYLLSYLGAAYLAQNELDRAEAALREARRLAGGRRDQYALAEIEHNLALVAQKREEQAARPS